MNLNERELAHVLAALRHTQDMGPTGRRLFASSDHFGGIEGGPLSDQEVDALC